MIGKAIAILLALSAASLAATPAPTPPPPPANQITADIQYGEAGGEKLLLDAHTPDGPGPFPVIIFVHGGGWGTGDKEGDMTPLFWPLIAKDFTWFSINYRLAPKDLWPACFDDVQTAIRWVKAHAADYKGDPKKIAIAGYSAGGNLVTLAVARAGADTQVQALVGFAPPSDIPSDIHRRGDQLSKSLQALFNHAPTPLDDGVVKQMNEMSAINYLHAGMPPTLLIHGTADQSVPYVQSTNLQTKLQALGVPCTLITIQGATHKIADWEKLDPTYKDKVVAWLKNVLAEPTAQTTPK